MNLDDFHDSWIKVVDKGSQGGYQSLSPAEKVWFNVQSLIQAIDDGGLVSFFYNSGADHRDDTKQALKTLGATNLVSALNKISDLFPSGVPQSVEARNQIIDSWSDDESIDELLESLDGDASEEIDQLEKRLVAFIQTERLGT